MSMDILFKFNTFDDEKPAIAHVGLGMTFRVEALTKWQAHENLIVTGYGFTASPVVSFKNNSITEFIFWQFLLNIQNFHQRYLSLLNFHNNGKSVKQRLGRDAL